MADADQQVCSACGSRHCLRMGGQVCMHTKKSRHGERRDPAAGPMDKAPVAAAIIKRR